MREVSVTVLNAIRDAQSDCIFGRFEDEPKVDSNIHLRLFEICHAIEQLSGNISLSTSEWQPQSQPKLLKALRNGELVARSHHTNSVIPNNSWPEDFADANEAFESDFWFGKIVRNESCVGYVGHLPVLFRNEAEIWLSAQFKQTKSRISNAKLRREWLAWIATFENPQKPTVEERYEWGRERGRSQRDIRKLVTDYAPDYWSKSGRPKHK